MKGYYTNDAIVVATESRTSSPVRIPRDADTLTHPQIKNLYPCGEGAGYAGGIVSAAMDGQKIVHKIDLTRIVKKVIFRNITKVGYSGALSIQFRVIKKSFLPFSILGQTQKMIYFLKKSRKNVRKKQISILSVQL